MSVLYVGAYKLMNSFLYITFVLPISGYFVGKRVKAKY